MNQNNNAPQKPSPVGMVVTIAIFIAVLVWVSSSDTLEIRWAGIPAALVLVIGSIVNYFMQCKRYKDSSNAVGSIVNMQQESGENISVSQVPLITAAQITLRTEGINRSLGVFLDGQSIGLTYKGEDFVFQVKNPVSALQISTAMVDVIGKLYDQYGQALPNKTYLLKAEPGENITIILTADRKISEI